MKTRYVLKGFVKAFAVASAGFLALFLLVQALGDIPDALKAGQRIAPGTYLLGAPAMFVRISPIITFFSAMLLVAEMLKNREIRVLEISGLDPYAVYAALAAGGMLAALAVHAVNDLAVPACGRRLAAGAPPATVRFAAPGFFLNGGRFIPPDTVEGLQMSEMGADGRLTVVQGARAVYRGGAWEVDDGMLWVFSGGRGFERRTRFRSLRVPSRIEPLLLEAETAGAGMLDLRTLARVVRRHAALGLRPRRLVVGLHEKIAYPLLNLFIVFAGLPFFALRGRMERFFVISLSTIVSFAWYLLYSFGIALALNSGTPPAAGVWMVHAAILAMSAAVLARRGTVR